jgi:hypothetical protein
VLLRERHFSEAEQQTHAGYDNVSRQSNPGTSFLQAARNKRTRGGFPRPALMVNAPLVSPP